MEVCPGAVAPTISSSRLIMMIDDDNHDDDMDGFGMNDDVDYD